MLCLTMGALGVAEVTKACVKTYSWATLFNFRYMLSCPHACLMSYTLRVKFGNVTLRASFDVCHVFFTEMWHWQCRADTILGTLNEARHGIRLQHVVTDADPGIKLILSVRLLCSVSIAPR